MPGRSGCDWRNLHNSQSVQLKRYQCSAFLPTDVAIIALIGSGMRGTVGVASKVFGAIEKNKVNVSMITQGSSELNLAFVVKNSDTNAAVRALHDEFALDKIN